MFYKSNTGFRRKIKERGLTFIEVLVWIFVFTFAMLVISSTLISLYRSNAYTIEQGQAVESARRGIAITIREMREAQYASNGAYPIVGMDENFFEFYSDVDEDSYVEKVRYEVVGTDFVRSVVNPSGTGLEYTDDPVSSVVSDNVRNIPNSITTFNYYDEEGILITDYTRVQGVRFVRLDLVVNVNPNRLPNELTLRSSAALRNLIGE